jgi:rubrerythrin
VGDIMPYVQVNNLLERAIEFHGMLTKFYSKIDNESEKESVKLLVNYMARHEAILKEQLEKITVEERKQLTEEWLPYVPESAEKRCFEGLEIDKDSTVDDVINTGVRLNQCLIDFYRRLAEISPSEELTALFSSLEAMEIYEKTILSRSIGM